MTLFDFLSIAGGLGSFGAVFLAGFFGEGARINELELAEIGGAL